MIYNNENINGNFLDPNFSEYDYLKKIVEYLNLNLDDNYHLYIIHDKFNSKIINEKNVVKIAIHIGNEVKFSNKNYDKFDYIFRFYLEHKCDYKKIFPISIGYNSSGKDNNIIFRNNIKLTNRKCDVFFMGNKNVRKSFYNSVKKYIDIYDLRFTDGFRKGLSINEYLDQLNNSKICLVPSGSSPETYRYTEAFASGCIVITTSKVDSWFYENSPAIFIKKWSDFNENLVKSILSSNLDIKYNNNLKYYNDKLSPEANAQYILNVLKNPNHINSKARKRSWLTKILKIRII